jgi:predicted ATP-dependent protease
MEGGLQAGKTRWTHYQTGYHLVWMPKYRRKVLRDDVAAEARKQLEFQPVRTIDEVLSAALSNTDGKNEPAGQKVG